MGMASTPTLVAACGGGASPLGIGSLLAPDANGLRLPPGFSSRVVAVSGEVPSTEGSAPWHASPDGGAVFARPGGGWIYASNSELPSAGGVGVLVFDAQGTVVDSYPILSGTRLNCAGGATPWNTWLSCEEFDDGRVWECDPFGVEPAVAKPALGLFAHEAVAVDAASRCVYLTEDRPDGRLYRFVADAADWPSGGQARFESGRLQVLRVLGDPDAAENNPLPVEWLDAANPGARQTDNRLTQSTPFAGGEGIWLAQGVVYFATKRDNRIWALDTQAQTLEILYDLATATGSDKILSGVDNLLVTAGGNVLVAEDGGDMQLCLIDRNRRVTPLLQLVGQDGSEICGPALSPDGRALYFSSQRGARNARGTGITYEVRLPFTL